MIDDPVIIDFGSCCRKGESLDGVGRTYNETVQTSILENDLNALREIHT